MEEVWKPVVDYEGLYEVSNLGRVKSLPKAGSSKELIMKQSKTMNGYLKVILCKNDIHKNMEVHRLVAKAFLNNEFNHPCVNHINGIKTDNRLCNLEFCTHKYNTREAIRLGLRGNRHTSVNQYDLNGNFIKRWYTITDASKTLNISTANICTCCKGRYKTAGGYIWRYVNK